MRIVLCYPVEARHVKQIAHAAPTVEVIDAGQERIAEEIRSADVFCGHAKVPVPWEDVVSSDRLRWIQSTAAGTDHCLVPSVIDSDVVVTSASGVLADQVAEHTVALMTSLFRSLPTFARAQRRREYVRRPTRDLHGGTVGIVGLGGVGRRLAEVLSTFDCRIVATDWCPVDRPAHVEALWPANRLVDLARRSDVVVLCAPLNEHTRGMIDETVLGEMRPGSYLINVARGGLIVETDLVDALASGHLAGAGLDVVESEPLSTASPLWEMPNVVITPHVAGQSHRRIDRMTDFFCNNLGRYMRGDSLLNLVDKRLGFPLRREV